MSAQPPKNSHTKGELWMILASLVMAGMGLPAIFAGEIAGWGATALFLFCAGVLVLMPRFRAGQAARPQETLVIDDIGVRRIAQDGNAQALAWTDLREVTILANASGEAQFELRGEGGSSVTIAQRAALEHKLVEELRRRLPDLDNEAVARALASTAQARFVVWPPQPAAGDDADARPEATAIPAPETPE